MLPEQTTPEHPSEEQVPSAETGGTPAVEQTPPEPVPETKPQEEEDTLLSPPDPNVEITEKDPGLPPNPNVHMTASPFIPFKPNYKVNATFSLSLLGVTVDDWNRTIAEYPKINFARSESGKRWLQNVEMAQHTLYTGGAFEGAAQREHARWGQSVQAGGEQLQAGRPKFGENTDPQGRLTGEHALMRLQTVLEVGAIIRVPLWHTGIWVSLKAPTEAALLELNRRIAMEKISLGRETNGLVFSNTSAYLVSYVANFAMAHIYDATYKYESIEQLKRVIRTTDLPLLVWGLLCTMFPGGYPYSRTCIRNPVVCNHVVEEQLSIGKLLWTDQAALTESQRKLMVRRNSKFTDIELDSYAKEHRYHKDAVVQLSDRIVMELRVPSILEYETSGFEWVDGIVKTVDQAFGSTVKASERDTLITDQGRITAMRQYAHWIDRIVLDGVEVIEDRTTIEDSLATLTATEELYDAFFTGIQKFIDNTAVSIVALPRYNCPNCQQPMDEEQLAHPNLVPLDVFTTFFILVDQRTEKVLRKEPRR